jgi:heptosyltransferase-1
MGDVIHTLPLVRLLKRRFNNISIDWIVNTSYVPLLSGNSDIDRIIEFPKHSFKKSPLKVLAKLKKELDQRSYTHVFDPQGLAKSALLSLLSGAERIIGFDRNTARELSWLFYSRSVDSRQFGPSIVSMNMGLAASVGIHASRLFLDRSSAHILGPWLKAEEDIFQPEKKLCLPEEKGRYILISPCAGWTTKEWPAQNYSNFVNLLQKEYSVNVKLIWAGEREYSRAKKIAETCSADILPETNIEEMLSVIRSSLLFIAGDTGPMHAANFLGVPCASIFTASDSVRNGPWFQPSLVVTPDIGCRGCKKRSCPDPVCVQGVSPKIFFNAVKGRFSDLLKEFSR